MKKLIWQIWMEDKKILKQDFEEALKNNKIKIEHEKTELIQSHLEKADHNLKFIKATLDLKEFNDWAIVSCYYAIYHASLALCASKGYSTKDHNATLLILIREFYKKGLEKEDLEIINTTTIEKEDILYYVEVKSKRKEASYSSKIRFEKNEVELLRTKSISFVNNVKTILEQKNHKNFKN